MPRSNFFCVRPKRRNCNAISLIQCAFIASNPFRSVHSENSIEFVVVVACLPMPFGVRRPKSCHAMATEFIASELCECPIDPSTTPGDTRPIRRADVGSLVHRPPIHMKFECYFSIVFRFNHRVTSIHSGSLPRCLAIFSKRIPQQYALIRCIMNIYVSASTFCER